MPYFFDCLVPYFFRIGIFNSSLSLRSILPAIALTCVVESPSQSMKYSAGASSNAFRLRSTIFFPLISVMLSMIRSWRPWVIVFAWVAFLVLTKCSLFFVKGISFGQVRLIPVTYFFYLNTIPWLY